MRDSLVRTTALMGTVVTVQVVGHGSDPGERAEREAGVARAFAWFERINDDCTRFDDASELARLCASVRVPVPVSVLLFQAVQFALAVADETDGAFDPTVGRLMAARGFNRDFRTGGIAGPGGTTARHVGRAPDAPSFRDVQLDADARTVTLRRALTLDLGAVAKGLAMDMAARELAPFGSFAIDAGGDLYLGGHNDRDEAWTVGIRHPRQGHGVIEQLAVRDMAVCTSGDYERLSPVDAGPHIVDPRTGEAVTALASVTVVAPSAMVADALATAAFVLGPVEGLALLERHGVRGLLVTPALDRIATAMPGP